MEELVTVENVSSQERRWLESWEDKLRRVADGELTEQDVCDWAWRNKVLNAINVTLQRIKRSERPGRDPRSTDSTWVTLAAERGRKKEDIGPLALQALAYVSQRLKERNHEFDVDWMASANGIVVISIHVKALRDYQRRRSAERP